MFVGLDRAVIGDFRPVFAVLAQVYMEFRGYERIILSAKEAFIRTERQAKVFLSRIECNLVDLELGTGTEQHVVDAGCIVLVFRIVAVGSGIRTNRYTVGHISHIIGTRTSLILPALECICEGELTICPLLSLLLIEIVSIDSIARGGGCNPAAVLFYGYGRLGLTPFAEFGVDKREGDFAFAQVRTGGQLGNRNGDRSVAFAAHRGNGSPIQVTCSNRPFAVRRDGNGLRRRRLIGEIKRRRIRRQLRRQRLVIVVGASRKCRGSHKEKCTEDQPKKMFTHKNSFN